MQNRRGTDRKTDEKGGGRNSHLGLRSLRQVHACYFDSRSFPSFLKRNVVRFTSREHPKTPLRLIFDSREWYFPYFHRKTQTKVVIVYQVRSACHTNLQASPAPHRLPSTSYTRGYARDNRCRSESSSSSITRVPQGKRARFYRAADNHA